MRLDLSTWYRATFAVHLWPIDLHSRGRAELVDGVIAGPFGIYRGTAYNVGRGRRGAWQYTLVHLPSQFPQFTLRTQALCRQAAQELGACDLTWESALWFGVIGAREEVEKLLEVRQRWGRERREERGNSGSASSRLDESTVKPTATR